MAYTTIDDSSAHFQTKIYTGNGSSGTAHTNDGNANLQPDYVWIKNRSSSTDNVNFDSSRGATKNVRSNTDAAESTNSNFLQAFSTDGFTVGDSARVNTNGDNYVAWQWKANGGTTTSNSNGSITSTVQANTTAGFSIVLYTGNETSGATVGHGLSGAPDVIWGKRRVGTGYWIISSNNLDTNGTTGGSPDAPRNMYFNTQDAGQSDKIVRAINATTFEISNSNSMNANTDAMLAYCFKAIKGFSHFGHYTGNGNADGAFIYTGFKPAWVMIKKSSGTGNWYIYDTERNGSSGSNTNQAHRIVYANDTSGEVDNSDRGIDMISNGFKTRNTLDNVNLNGDEYFYMAFASSPLVSSAGVPTTAR
tara:strand:+ start:57 stop:1145 length:1089 start_codon:yes stop_codon:yes gene_type:complete